MMVDSITFNTAENKIVVTFEDGATKEYLLADKAQYLADYPERTADVLAMNW
jgi:hypothetical protein